MEIGTGKGSDGSDCLEGQSPFLAAIRREVEALEDRLLARISRLEQQHLHFEAALENVARFDTKLQDVEASQLKSEVTIAQLSGQMKAAMDQLQSVQRCAAVSSAPACSPRGVDSRKSTPKAGELTLPALGDQVARLSEKIEAHSDALAQVRKVLELQLLQQHQQQQQQQEQQQQQQQEQQQEQEQEQERQQQEKRHLQEVKRPYPRPRGTIQDEMRILAECIASAEGAIFHLAPKLLKAAEAAQSKPEILQAAESLQAAVGHGAACVLDAAHAVATF